jgi:hypothetical protein
VVDENDNVSNWRMARLDDVVFLEKPADSHSPKRIDYFAVAEPGADGGVFKLDASRLVFSLCWQHKAEPPDFELVLMQQDAELWERWVDAASLTLLAALRRRAPHAIDWAGMPDVIPVLDALEAMASKTAHRH